MTRCYKPSYSVCLSILLINDLIKILQKISKSVSSSYNFFGLFNSILLCFCFVSLVLFRGYCHYGDILVVIMGIS